MFKYNTEASRRTYFSIGAGETVGVVDGVAGSKFLGTLKSYLENPVLFMGANNI